MSKKACAKPNLYVFWRTLQSQNQTTTRLADTKTRMSASTKLFDLLKCNPKKAATFCHANVAANVDLELFRDAWLARNPTMVNGQIMIREHDSDVFFLLLHEGRRNFSVLQCETTT